MYRCAQDHRFIAAMLVDRSSGAEAEAKAALAQGHFKEFWLEAWACRDRMRLIAAGRVMCAGGRPTSDRMARYIEALLAEGLHEEALEALADGAAEEVLGAAAATLQARALAGLGRFADALAAAEQALERNPASERTRKLVKILRWTSALRNRVPGLSWAEWRPLLESCVLFAARASARRILGDLAGAPAPPDSTARTATSDAATVLSIAAELLDADSFSALLDKADPVLAGDERIAAWRLEVSRRSGRAWSSAQEAISRGDPDLGSPALACARAVTYDAAGETEAALNTFGRLGVEPARDVALFGEMARTIGSEGISLAAPRYAPVGSRSRRVFNLIPFNNELELLEIRLQEMADWVDGFVIVESGQSFTGEAKPRVFEQNRDRFRRFASKIHYVGLDKFPAFANSAWARNCFQRDMAIAGASGLWSPADWVLISDADEIVDRSVLRRFNGVLASLMMTRYKFFFNYGAGPGNLRKLNDRCGVLCRAELLVEFGASYLRFCLSRQDKDWNYIPEAGWHFTSVGHAAGIAAKFRAHAHQGEGTAALRQEADVAQMLDAIRAGRVEPGWMRYELDERFPRALRDRRQALEDMIL